MLKKHSIKFNIPHDRNSQQSGLNISQDNKGHI